MARAAKFLGKEALQKKLAAMPQAAKDEIAVAMAKAADEIVGMAQRLVPVATGKLRDSIGWTWGEAPKGAMRLATVAGKGPSDLRLTVYAGSSDAFYARWVEFGTVKTPAQPFFYVSYRAQRKGAKRIIRAAARKAAKKVAAR